MNKRENIQETERLAIRKLTHDDFETLIAIMASRKLCTLGNMASVKMMYDPG